MESETSLQCSYDLPLVPNLSQMNPVHTLPSYFPKIYSNIIFPQVRKTYYGLVHEKGKVVSVLN
jgi:hypothetical protein